MIVPNFRIEAVGHIDQWIGGHARVIDAPVSEPLAVRAPAKSLVQAEFLFVDPVKCCIHHGIGTVLGDGGDLKSRRVLNIEISLADVGDFPTVRGKFRKHQRRRGRIITAQLPQFA